MSCEYLIEFDGGTSCNIPSKGFGNGYGSFQINDWPIQRVDFGAGHSCNSAEIRTLIRALQFLKDTDPGSVTSRVLIRGDSKIALKWVLFGGPVKQSSTPMFRSAVADLRAVVREFTSLRTEWRGRLHSAALFGH